MKTFEQFMNEQNSVSGVALPDSKIGLIKRKNMPQIREFESFIKDITETGHMVTTIKKQPFEFIPTQSEFNDEKVQAMIDNGSFTSKPIISTNDDHIIDGHHRWKAALETSTLIASHQVNMTVEEIFEFLQDKPYIVKKDINESRRD